MDEDVRPEAGQDDDRVPQTSGKTIFVIAASVLLGLALLIVLNLR